MKADRDGMARADVIIENGTVVGEGGGGGSGGGEIVGIACHAGLASMTVLFVIRVTPPSRDQSLALTHLEESMRAANAAVAKQWPVAEFLIGSQTDPSAVVPTR